MNLHQMAQGAAALRQCECPDADRDPLLQTLLTVRDGAVGGICVHPMQMCQRAIALFRKQRPTKSAIRGSRSRCT